MGGHHCGQQDMAEPVGAELFQVIEGKIQFYRAVKVKQLSNDLLLAHCGDLGTHLFKRKISGHLYLPFYTSSTKKLCSLRGYVSISKNFRAALAEIYYPKGY